MIQSSTPSQPLRFFQIQRWLVSKQILFNGAFAVVVAASDDLHPVAGFFLIVVVWVLNFLTVPCLFELCLNRRLNSVFCGWVDFRNFLLTVAWIDDFL